MKVLKLVCLLFFSSLCLISTAQEPARDTFISVYTDYTNMMKTGRLFDAKNCLSGLLKSNIQMTAKQKLAVNNNLGILHKDLGQYDIALKYYDAAETICLNNSFKDNTYLASIYYNKMNIYSVNEEYNKVIEYTEKAIRSVRESNASPILKQTISSSLYLGAGNAYTQLNDFDQALSSLQKSLSIKNKYNLPQKEYVYQNYARIFAEMGNKSLADKYFNLSIRTSERENKSLSFKIADIYIEYSNFLLSINENAKALTVAKKVLNVNLKSFGEKDQPTSDCYQLLGDNYRKVKDCLLYTSDAADE